LLNIISQEVNKAAGFLPFLLQCTKRQHVSGI
jgi:hypothetical protein